MSHVGQGGPQPQVALEGAGAAMPSAVQEAAAVVGRACDTPASGWQRAGGGRGERGRQGMGKKRRGARRGAEGGGRDRLGAERDAPRTRRGVWATSDGVWHLRGNCVGGGVAQWAVQRGRRGSATLTLGDLAREVGGGLEASVSVACAGRIKGGRLKRSPVRPPGYDSIDRHSHVANLQ